LKTILIGIAILFATILAFAKDHKAEDYPLKVVVRQANYHPSEGDVSPKASCHMAIAADSTIWSIHSNDWHCRNFPVGTELYGRLRNLMGEHFIYLAWPENGKLREAYWVIDSATRAANSENESSASPSGAKNSTGSLAVNTSPDGADIYVDGQFYGNGPAILKLKPGEHTIKVILSGYREWSREISTEVGTEAHLSASLEKLD